MTYENLCYFVASRGLLQLCVSKNREPQSSSNRIDQNLLGAHKPYDSIYICSDALENFVENVLPKIRLS